MSDRRAAAGTQTLEREATAWRDLPLAPTPQPVPPSQPPEPRAADRIKDALLRWLEEEL